MDFQLALVTGASSGIGKSLCHLLAEKGVNLIISGRKIDALKKLEKDLQKKISLIVHVGDLEIPKERSSLISIIHKNAPDLIVNNAGIGLYGHCLSHKTEEQLKIVEVNVQSLLEITLEGARSLISKNKRGTIMNISSISSFTPFPNFSTYAASKAFVNNFSKAFDVEMKKYHIRILAACPGIVDTPFRYKSSLGTSKKTASPMAMSAHFTAEEIWKQIQKSKTIHIFDWRYRLARFLIRIIPEKILLPMLSQKMDKLHNLKNIIKL